MALYHLRPDRLEKLAETSFPHLGIRERTDLQRTIRNSPQILGGDLLIISEEFGDWEDSSRRIDLLAVDTSGHLVVIELKREGAGFADLQAIRYAAMVANMTFERVKEAFEKYLQARKRTDNAEELLLDFLPSSENGGVAVRTETPRIILVAADFSRELTTTVLWLNDIGLDIRCIELSPYEINGEQLIDATQIIPVPKAEERIVRIRERTDEVSKPRYPTIAWTSSDIARLRSDLSNPTIRSLFDLCSAHPNARISFATLLEKTGRTREQARGDLAGLTMFIKSRFGRGNWPVAIDWNAAGDNQAHYWMDEKIARWWMGQHHPGSSPQDDEPDTLDDP